MSPLNLFFEFKQHLKRKLATFIIKAFLFFVQSARVLTVKRIFPKIFFYSLTYEQIFKNSNPESLLEFIKQLEKKGLVPSGEIKIEMKKLSLARLFYREFVFDIETYLAYRCLGTRELREIFRRLRHEIEITNVDSLYTAIDQWKSSCFDLSIWECIYESLDEEIFILTTPTSINKMPCIYFDSFKMKTKRLMIWYSNNSYQILREDNRENRNLPHQNLKGKIDLHLVWSEHQSRYFEQIGLGASFVWGPITFQDPSSSKRRKKSKPGLTIVYFDVTPMKNPPDTIYTIDFALANLNAAIELKDMIEKRFGYPVNLILKQKREFQKGHHSEYYRDFVKQQEKRGLLRIESPYVNLFSIIANASLVIGVPFTSPIQIGQFLKIPSCYLAFNSSGWRLSSDLLKIPIIRNIQEMREYVDTLPLLELM